MTLNKNQYVVFPDGHKEGYLEARWSEKNQAFYSFIETENGSERVYSTEIIEKQSKGSKKFVPDAKNCTVRIFPCGETEKAYRIADGTNGKITRGNMKIYYKYVAKSICYVDDDGNVFAPLWA